MLDGDVLPDVCTANYLEKSLSVLMGNPSSPGTLLPALDVRIGAHVIALTSVDLEEDRDTDLAVVAKEEFGPVSYLFIVTNAQDKSGQTQLTVNSFPTKNYPANVLAADVDDDGDQDLIIVNTDGSTNVAGASSSIEVLLNENIPSNPADLNGDGVVNVHDLLAVIAAWGACPSPPVDCAADIAPPGGNGMVNVQDLLFVIQNWG